MTDSSSDSDCFESADEGFDDENSLTRDNVTGKNGSRHVEPPSRAFTDAYSPQATEVSHESNATKSSLQYRKRPERGKNLPKTVPAFSTQSRKTSHNDQIFKTDIIKPDVLIQDITSNLSKNLNKGFNTIQQTSSSIKDLVMSSLPVTAQKETVGRFSYDEEVPPQQAEFDSENYENDIVSETDGEICDSKTSQLDSLTNEGEKGNLTQICSEASAVEMDIDKKKKSLDLQIGSEIHTLHISDLTSVKKEDPDETVTSIMYKGNDNTEVLENILDESKPKEIFTDCDNQESAEERENYDMQSKKGTIEMSNKEGSFERENNEKSEIKSSHSDELEKCESKDSLAVDSNDDFRLESGAQEVVGDSLNDKDGWDVSELDLEGTDVEESSSPTEKSVDKIEDKKSEAYVRELDSQMNDNDGWDDFDFDDEDIQPVVESRAVKPSVENTYNAHNKFGTSRDSSTSHYEERHANNNKWSGWDKFGEKTEKKQKSGWSLGGWGVNALLNTATSVTQGLSNVLEVGLGAPDPETLARMEIEAGRKDISAENKKEYRRESGDSSQSHTNENVTPDKSDESSSLGLNLFPGFGITNLVAGVTNKIVENSVVQEIGSKVISGGLDTLESFGKKTMEVLQEGDPGLKKKRALLLGSDKPILSQVLREAKAKAEIQDRKMEEKQLAKMCHFETLFDDFQGLVHLEALEMLSRQCELKLEQMKTSLSMKEVEDLIGILDEVKELCVIDEDEFKSNYSTMVDFKNSLKKAIEPLSNEISIHKIVQVYDDLNAWLKLEENCRGSPQILFQKATSTLAELTAATVQQFHKGGELLSVKEHRKTVEEADSLLQMTGFLCREINEIAEKFLKFYTSAHSHDERMATKIKEEATNAISYIKDAFNLLIPVLQLGAAT